MKFIFNLERNKMPVSLTGIVNNDTVNNGDTLVFCFPNGKQSVLIARKDSSGKVILPPSDISESTASVYSCIVDFISVNGYPPTVREIADGVGLSSTCTIHHHLRKLQNEGLITLADQSPRAIKVTGYKYVREEN